MVPFIVQCTLTLSNPFKTWTGEPHPDATIALLMVVWLARKEGIMEMLADYPTQYGVDMAQPQESEDDASDIDGEDISGQWLLNISVD